MESAMFLMVIGFIIMFGTTMAGLWGSCSEGDWKKFWKGMFVGTILMMVGFFMLNDGTAMKGRRVVLAQEYPGYTLVSTSAGNFTLVKGSHAVVCHFVKRPWPYIVVPGRN